MPHRDKTVQKEYNEYLAEIGGKCPFCEITNRSTDQILESRDTMMVLFAKFPYKAWDGRDVESHLMAVPKRHTDSLHELNDDESTEFITLIKKYEKNGYSVYARSAGNGSKTIEHQHTHLIKII
jgi:diadenosine tetraphosphate (Ap4A) HIT family hydrolase